MNFRYSCNLHVEVHISFVAKGLEDILSMPDHVLDYHTLSLMPVN